MNREQKSFILDHKVSTNPPSIKKANVLIYIDIVVFI